MAHPILWTPLADTALIQLRAANASWHLIARHLHVGRSAAIERARCLGIPPKTRLPVPPPRPPMPRIDRAPLPAGHPITWGAITHDVPYPHPVFL